jgi:ATP phosphoribosyltransferase regulatory subunit
MLGVHSDITPQIARIDSKRSKSERVDRYCYINAILQTKADDFYASRSPIQAGAELYGFNGIEADIEVITLMIESLALLGLDGVTLSLGNTSIFNALCDSANLDAKEASKLRDIFRRKSIPDLNSFLENNQIQEDEKFKALISLDGSETVLDKAASVFKDIPSALSAIGDLRKLYVFFKDRNINLMFDLGEVKAYEYHDGVVFAAYHDSFSKALAQGGRYSGLTKSFGSSRDATGFSFDLKFLVQQQLKTVNKQKILVAPNSNDSKLTLLINELRSNGHNIKVDLTGLADVDFENTNNEWQLKE